MLASISSPLTPSTKNAKLLYCWSYRMATECHPFDISLNVAAPEGPENVCPPPETKRSCCTVSEVCHWPSLPTVKRALPRPSVKRCHNSVEGIDRRLCIQANTVNDSSADTTPTSTLSVRMPESRLPAPKDDHAIDPSDTVDIPVSLPNTNVSISWSFRTLQGVPVWQVKSPRLNPFDESYGCTNMTISFGWAMFVRSSFPSCFILMSIIKGAL